MFLLARIQPVIDQSRRPQQSGFTAGRSTIDAILALRLLSEQHREFDWSLNVALLDIKSAFDSVDRTALWKALCSKGMHDIILHMSNALHENTSACVRLRRKLSPRISTTSGVRQGCILAPIIFCVAVDWLSFNPGITVGSSTFTDLRYDTIQDAILTCARKPT